MIKNLNAKINEIAYKIASDIKDNINYKNEVDKALGVLSNDGVYAYYVYVKSKGIDKFFLDELVPIKAFLNLDEHTNKLDENFFKELSENLNNLLFFHEIIKNILIYVRYHLKAMGD